MGGRMKSLYFVKTRNFNASAKTYRIMRHVADLFKATRHESDDFDVKVSLETTNAFKAWAAWACFIALRRWSGGWTYIIRPNHELGAGYKSIY